MKIEKLKIDIGENIYQRMERFQFDGHIDFMTMAQFISKQVHADLYDYFAHIGKESIVRYSNIYAAATKYFMDEGNIQSYTAYFQRMHDGTLEDPK